MPEPLAYVPLAQLMEVLQARFFDRPGNSVHTLAKLSGVNAKTLACWERGEVARVRFGHADRVLASIGAVDAWHAPPLRCFYYSEEPA